MGEYLFYALLIILAIWIISKVVKSHQDYVDKQNKSTREDFIQLKKKFKHVLEDKNKPTSEDFLPPFITNVARVTFEGRQSVVDSLQVGETLVLVQESDNPNDKKAIRVERRNGVQIGYIPRELAKDMDWHFDALGTPRPAAEVLKKNWLSLERSKPRCSNKHSTTF